MRIIIATNDDWQRLLELAEEGDADAQLEVAVQYGSGIIVNGVAIAEPDEKLEYEWTKRAYENGCADAVEFYANHLSNGIYCTKDTAGAMKLYRKAMKAGSSSAAHNLGLEYQRQHKFKKAFSLYKKAHTDSSPDSSVGLCYYYGVGVAQDRLKAFRFFKSILEGDAYISGYDENEANYMMGKMYLEGEVVKRSIKKARYYLLLANEDGDHIAAEDILGIIGLK